MISRSPEEQQLYEARMKFLHDNEGQLIAARREGREEGREEGRAEGRKEGREEGFLVGKIQGLRELLGDTESSFDDLLQFDRAKRIALLSELQTRIRARGA